MSVADIDDDDEKWLMNARSVGPNGLNNMLGRTARDGDVWRVMTLIDLGADINHNDGIALSMAAGGGHTGIIEKLIERGIDFNAAKDDALSEAAAHGQEKAVRFLIAKGADAAHDNSICLFFAVQKNNPGVVQALLDGGADVNGNSGTLLCIALAHQHEDVARVLLENGADPRNHHRGMNAYEWAAEMGLPAFSKLLHDRMNTDVFMSPGFFRRFTALQLTQEVEDRPGRHTGLHLAAQAGCFDVVRDKFLAAPGTKLLPDDLLKKDTGGRSVLFLLAQAQQLDIAFDPRLWAGRKNEMLAAYAGVPSAFRGTLDLPALVTAVDQLTLQSRAPKPALRLKPPGR